MLISGAGIAGPTLAYWLAHYGWKPVLIERADRFRTGGYVIDFWGSGYEIASRMGILPAVKQAGYEVRELRIVDARGRRIAGANVDGFLRITGGRYVSLQRGDLAASIFGTLEDRVETIFGDAIERMEQRANGVHVEFERGTACDFDLVVGADGLHSRVRELMFGSKDPSEKYLGIGAAAFEIDRYSPRDELVYVMYSEVGRQAARFSMRDDRTMVLLTFLDRDGEPLPDPNDQRALLHDRFAGCRWEIPEMLRALDRAGDWYFDRVSQVRIEPPQAWSQGRIALVGDAASCVSLLAGEGCGLAMTAAYILAGELYRAGGDYAAAFERYQQRFGPLVRAKQRAALRFASSFAPKTRVSLWLRNATIDLLGIPWLADRLIGAELRDDIELPVY